MRHHLVVDDADGDVLLPGQQAVDGGVAQAAGQQAVQRRRRSAPLEVTDDGDLGLHARQFVLDALGDAGGAAHGVAFGDDDDREELAAGLVLLQDGLEVFQVGGRLGDENRRGAGTDGGVQGDVAGVAAHHLHEEEAVVAIGRVADLIHGLDGGVDGRVETDRVVGAVEVVIDRSGDADEGHAVLLGEDLGAGERAVTADGDTGVDVVAAQVLGGLHAALGRHETHGAGGAQHGAAALDDVGDVAAFEAAEMPVDHPLVAPLDPVDVKLVPGGGPHDGAQGGVHAGGVTSGGKNGNATDIFSFHGICNYWARTQVQV